MSNKIIIRHVNIESHRIEVTFDVSEGLRKFFKAETSFFTEYSENIQQTPVGVAVIHFICNVLPIVWLTDAVLETPSLDKNFYDSINEFKKGYVNMYPMLHFKGAVHVGNIEKYSSQGHNTAAFFSGGVDAFATLIAHVDEKPILLTVWGADIKLNDLQGWDNVKKHVEQTCENFHLNKLYIKSNFREFLAYKTLEHLIKKTGDNWWHGFQHGIGLLGLGAPGASCLGISTIYIASSFTFREKGLVTCASDPSIDNFVRFCGSQIVHDQYEYNRQEKIRHICEFVQKNSIPIHLRVCWTSSGGKNCCHCEKCYRTMFGLFAEGVDPKDYGMDYTDEDLEKSYNKLKYQISFRFKPIQARFICNEKALSMASTQWIYTCDIDQMSKMTFKKRIYVFSQRIYRKLKSVMHL